MIINDPVIDAHVIVQRLERVKDKAVTRLAFKMLINLMGAERPR